MDLLALSPRVVTWIVAAIAVTGVIIRPFNIMEAIWPVGAVAVLLLFGLIKPDVALAGVAKGTDVYLFLTGMMLLAEVARKEGLFDWLAAFATTHAKGSSERLLLLTYIVGTAVTVFLSNDATAVVLTPAVAAAVKAANAKEPLPYLLVCAFVANAASFVLPISNPAKSGDLRQCDAALAALVAALSVALGPCHRLDLCVAALGSGRRLEADDR